MNIARLRFIILTLVLLLGIVIADDKAKERTNQVTNSDKVKYPSGWDSLKLIELLPLLPPNGTMTKQFISYDTSGGNGHGWQHWSRYTDSNGQWVIFDEIGPGCLYRLQMNVWHLPINPNAKIYFYFDDETKPRLESTFNKLFGKDQKFEEPFSPPIIFFDDRTGQHGKDRFAILYHPFPFERRLKITMDAQPPQGEKWYQFTHTVYPAGYPIQSWKGPGLDDSKVREIWNNLGKSPLALSNTQKTENSLKLKPNEKGILFATKGSGLATSLSFKIEPFTPETLAGLRVRIKCDEISRPTIDMPLGCLVGAGGPPLKSTSEAWKKQLKSLFIGYDHQTLNAYCYWPMPFWSKYELELINECPNTEVAVSLTVELAPNILPKETSGYFFAKRTIDGPNDQALYATAFEDKGWGKIVGLFFYSDNYNMDGDEFTFLDGSRTTQIHGDGTEDDHNQGWGGDAFQKALWGGTINGYNGGYRFYLGEAYVFNQEIRMTYEHSLWGSRAKNVVTDIVCYYYKGPDGEGNLRLTDELEIGEVASEKSHEYTVTNSTGEWTVNSAYDGYEMNPQFDSLTDKGKSFTGTSRFTLKIDINNKGVLLRRRIDKNTINLQTVAVTVNNQILPTPWYTCHLPSPAAQAWADTDYFIPAEFTKGKDKITLEIKYVSSSNPKLGINEFKYEAWCYGKTLLAPSGFMVSENNKGALEVKWLSSPIATKGYRLERLTKSGNFEEIGQLGPEVLFWNESNRESFKKYTYRICAEGQQGTSPWATATLTTGPANNERNCAVDGVASASTSWEDNHLEHAPIKAIDGNLNSRWNSAVGKSAGEWLAIKWEKPINIQAIKIDQETQWTRITSFSIQYKSNNEWMTIYEGKNMENSQIIPFAELILTQEIRLLINQTSGNTPSIKELAVYAK